jgi:hypothetical protein
VPKVGTRVEVAQGAGRIAEINAVRGRVIVELEEGGKVELTTAAVARHKPGCPHTGGPGIAGADEEAGEESGVPEEEL